MSEEFKGGLHEYSTVLVGAFDSVKRPRLWLNLPNTQPTFFIVSQAEGMKEKFNRKERRAKVNSKGFQCESKCFIKTELSPF